MKLTIVHLRHIEILSYHMDSIYFRKNLTWLFQQCGHIHLKKYAVPHYKCVLCCCAQFTRIDITSLESDQHSSNVNPTINFHVYQNISCCTVHEIRPFNKDKECQRCESSTYAIVTKHIIQEESLS